MGIRGSLDHVVRSPYLQDDPPFSWFLVKSQVFMTQLLPNLDLAVFSPSPKAFDFIMEILGLHFIPLDFRHGHVNAF